MKRAPETLLTLYAELLDQAIQAEAESLAARLPPPGSFVSKEVKGGRYWYLQRVEAGHKRQYYLGPDSPQLRRWIRRSREQRAAQRPDTARREELVSMLLAGGAVRESAAFVRILRLLAETGVFRLGGVLVGTQAFTCYANMLGVRFDTQTQRTQDVDLAQDPSIPVAVDPEAVATDILAALQEAEPGFFAVPALDPRRPSTSFKVRGRDLRVDLLTPERGSAKGPVILPLLAAAATPLPFLEYLIASPERAVVVADGGILVQVPQPGRFVFHKLWTSENRPASEQAKARKDLVQASELLEVLHLDRPRDLGEAWAAVPTRRRRNIAAAIRRLDDAVRPIAVEVTGVR